MDILRKQRHGVLFYSCTHPAWGGAAHGFSTRIGGVSPAPWNTMNLGVTCGDEPDNVRENFRRFCAAVGTSADVLVKNHQVHGDIVRCVTARDRTDDLSAPGTFDADGLVTDEVGVCLTVFSADCIPVLLYDPVRRCIAAAHAGWRGTAAGIAGRCVQVMAEKYGCDPKNILAAIGPGISSCCFETHRDVPDGLTAGLGEHAQPFIRPASLPGKFNVDLKGANARWLELAGVDPEHIAICPACSACDLDTFFSHRILGKARGSMAAMIQLLPSDTL